MIYEPQMAPDDAAQVARRLTEFWPQPELTRSGHLMLIQSVLDTGLTFEEAMVCVRHLMQERHQFRPMPADLRAARPAPPPRYFQPFAVLAEAPPADTETVKAALVAARGVLGADMESTRAAKAARDAQRGALTEGDREHWDRYVKVGEAAKQFEASHDSGT